MARISKIATLALATTAFGQPTSAAGCTTTMTITVSRLSTPPYWPQCSFDGTERIYSSTVTMSHAVDCHGCNNIQVRYEPIVHCPANIITATAKESTPYTAHRTICAQATAA